MRGERLPTAKQQWSLARSMKRQFLVDQNILFKRNLEYESDDDFGEDLGQDIQMAYEDDDFTDSEDEEGGPVKQKTEEELMLEEMEALR